MLSFRPIIGVEIMTINVIIQNAPKLKNLATIISGFFSDTVNSGLYVANILTLYVGKRNGF
jgi:hypothetical protein